MTRFGVAAILAASVGCLYKDGDTEEWSYDGETGPAYWADLDPDYAACGEGTVQSPVDLDASHESADLSDLSFDYQPSSVEILNNGHTIEYVIDEGSTLTLDGVDYALEQFHFHATSENTVDGVATPMEAHLVHEAADGSLAVVGVFIEEGEETGALAEWSYIPDTAGTTVTISDVTVDASGLVPGGPTWRFSGSLTTPPCTEGVSWVVYQTPITLSADQIALFTAIYDHNHRPVQDLNGREVAYGE